MQFSPVLTLLLDTNIVLHSLILTYGSTVWWRVVRCVSRTEFIKLQKLAYLAIPGVLMTAPTAAMEVLLGLHLHVMPGARPRQGRTE